MKAINYTQYRRASEKEYKRHDGIMKELKIRLGMTQKKCSHKNTAYYQDPSGNNDSCYECLDCGKWV
jgi:hypothetical protein